MYNNRGRMIAHPAEQSITDGRRFFHWNGENEQGESVGSGVCFCRLASGDAFEVQGLVLVGWEERK